ncbi:MAG: prepilin-type N-terminal cleavage/methylation domain-containing protein [Gemmatimonadota bacterium]|jgi:prepilin-type N-terminal cleavage/methylation domain-containing protein
MRSVARGGFTLLEAMVALVILGLVVTASFQLYGSALRSVRDAREWTAAAAYAQEGMELAKLDAGSMVSRGTEALEGGFRRQVRVRSLDAHLAELTVSVRFPGGGIFEVSRLVSAP